MPALVEVEHVEARLQRSLAGAELTAAQSLIDEVSAMARLAVAGLADLVAASADHATVVAGRLAAAVERVLRNPSGFVREQVDDYSYQRADATARGALYLSDEDLRVLAGVTAAGAPDVPGQPRTVSLWG